MLFRSLKSKWSYHRLNFLLPKMHAENLLLLRLHPIKPCRNRCGRIGNLMNAAIAVENILQGLPRYRWREVRGVLDDVIRVQLAGELKHKFITHHQRRLQLRRIQGLHMNKEIGVNSTGVVSVVGSEDNGVIAGVGPYM